MIKAILVFNNHGKPRLSKFYQFYVSLKFQNQKTKSNRFDCQVFVYRLSFGVLNYTLLRESENAEV